MSPDGQDWNTETWLQTEQVAHSLLQSVLEVSNEGVKRMVIGSASQIAMIQWGQLGAMKRFFLCIV